MSRFYEALKEASRSRPVTDNQVASAGPAEETAAAEESPAVSGVRSAYVAPVLTPISEPLPTGVHAAHRVSHAVAAEEPTSPLATAFSNDFFGVHTQVILDEQARLVPHAVDSVVVEHYRRLRTKILQRHADNPFRTLMVASPGAQEGKTVTVLNLALNFAMLQNLRILVVDGDLRRGSLGKWLGIESHSGLSNLIEGTSTLEDVVLKCDELPIHFMVRGQSAISPAELLNSPSVPEHFRRMGEHFDFIFVDSPPVNLIADAHMLALHCDAVLLIARAFSTTRKSLEQAMRDLNGCRLIGTVLNGGTRAQLYRRYNGYY